MKKTFLSLLCGVLFLISCNTKSNSFFEVSGKILNAPSTRVLLEELPFGGQQPIVIDSATIAKDGSFKLKTITKEEGLYLLVIVNGPEVLLINDSKSMVVNLDVNHYKAYTTQNSEASKKLHNFLELYSNAFNEFVGAITTADTLSKTKASDSLITLANQKKDAALKGINQIVTAYTDSSNSAALSYYLIGKAFKTMELDAIKKLMEAAVAKFPNHSGIKKLDAIVAAQISKDPKLALMNKPAPDLHLKDTAGNPISISQFKGKYVLVDFWASWCRPCREENPNVVKAYQQFKDKNFTILGVSLDSSHADWSRAINNDSLKWNHGSDLKHWESEAVKQYKFEGIPFNVLISPEGNVIATSLLGNALEEKLSAVLK